MPLSIVNVAAIFVLILPELNNANRYEVERFKEELLRKLGLPAAPKISASSLPAVALERVVVERSIEPVEETILTGRQVEDTNWEKAIWFIPPTVSGYLHIRKAEVLLHLGMQMFEGEIESSDTINIYRVNRFSEAKKLLIAIKRGEDFLASQFVPVRVHSKDLHEAWGDSYENAFFGVLVEVQSDKRTHAIDLTKIGNMPTLLSVIHPSVRARRALPSHEENRCSAVGPNQRCCRADRWINFEEEKDLSFIILPRKVNLGYCEGSCTGTLLETFKRKLGIFEETTPPGNQTVVKACKPNGYETAMFVYRDENEEVHMKNIDIIIDRCICA